MSRYSPSGKCCRQVCQIVDASSLTALTAWTILNDTWTEDDGTFTVADDGASAVTYGSANGAQHVGLYVTAGAAGQVFDVMLGCDAAGVPGIFARLTFGDGSVPGSCGSLQLFEFGSPLEDAQPIFGLVDGIEIEVSLCADADLSVLFCQLRDYSGFFPLPIGNATALLSADASGRLGFRLVEAQSATATVEPIEWQNIFISGQTCKTCHICGTGIGNANPDGLAAGSSCLSTVSGPFYFGVNIVGYASVAAHTIVSALDRKRGYGVQAGGYAILSDAAATVMEVRCDNGHYGARLTVSPRIAGTCAGFISTPYHLDLYLQILKDGIVQDTSAPVCVGFSFSGPELFTLGLDLWFCTGVAYARGGVIVGAASGTTAILSTVGEPLGGGSAHGVTFTRGGGGLGITRCLNCTQCEECDDVVSPPTRSWRVVVAGTAHDGTHILSSGDGVCTVVGAGGGAVWELTTHRYGIHVGVRRPPPNSTLWLIEGTSGPLSDCESIVDEVIDLGGGATATVTAL